MNNTGEYFSYYASLCVVILAIVYSIIDSKKKLKLPPGPFGLPIVGYLPFLRKRPLEKLKEMSEKYGNIFRLRLGMSSVVVVTDFEALQEAFGHPATLDRPPNLFHDTPDKLGLTTANGTEWKEQRRFTMKTMRDFGLGKSEWQSFVQDEVDEFVQVLEKQKGEPFYMKRPLVGSIFNNMFHLIFGYRLPDGHPKKNTVTNGIYSFPRRYTQTGLHCFLLNIFGFLEKTDSKLLNSETNDANTLNLFIREEINKARKSMNEKYESSYVNSYLKKMKEDEHLEKSSFNDFHLTGNIQSILFGGTGTILTTLMWLFLAMASYPEIQRKVQEEVDNTLGKLNKPQWKDKTNFPYTFAAILEGMRWRTVVPMNIQRRTSEDIKICGYDIPKNTVIIGLLWAVHSNSKNWKNPEKFEPERFIDANGALATKPQGWVPFSYGKRGCPAETPGMIEIFLYFTTIMQKFTILNIDTEQPPDLESVASLVLSPKQQSLRFVPRFKKTNQ